MVRWHFLFTEPVTVAQVATPAFGDHCRQQRRPSFAAAVTIAPS
jgi:hypothetical protein